VVSQSLLFCLTTQNYNWFFMLAISVPPVRKAFGRIGLLSEKTSENSLFHSSHQTEKTLYDVVPPPDLLCVTSVAESPAEELPTRAVHHL
jgi:hypothetical protein